MSLLGTLGFLFEDFSLSFLSRSNSVQISLPLEILPKSESNFLLASFNLFTFIIRIFCEISGLVDFLTVFKSEKD